MNPVKLESAVSRHRGEIGANTDACYKASCLYMQASMLCTVCVWEYDQVLLWQSPCFEATVTHHTRRPVTLLLVKLAGARTLSSLPRCSAHDDNSVTA